MDKSAVATEERRQATVAPQLPKGFADALPADAYQRIHVIETIRAVYERYGFQPLETPAVEYLTTLVGSGGDEVNKQIFRFESPEREAVGLRFDLTVPFARVLAQYRDQLKLPFRRYQIGPVFRADKPDPGRYRQFTQFDADAAGSHSVSVDAEIVAMMRDALAALGFSGGFHEGAAGSQIRVNNRKLMDCILAQCGIDVHDNAENSQRNRTLRVIDKLLKIGLPGVEKELGEGRMDASGDFVRGVGLPAASIKSLLDFLAIAPPSRAETLAAVIGKLKGDGAKISEAAEEAQEFVDCLGALGLAEAEVVFDLGLVRGLLYYTGPVFEACVADRATSVMGGGRYDGLIDRFSTTHVACTGASFGVERLVRELQRAGMAAPEGRAARALVLSLKGVPASEALRAARELREAGIAAECYHHPRDKSPASAEPGAPKPVLWAGMGEQMSFANARGFAAAVILGPDEIEQAKVSIKDLALGRESREGIQDKKEYRGAGKAGQVTVARAEMAATVRAILERKT